MGVVYKAQDLKLDRFVALKFLPQHLHADEAEKQRFIHEARAASALDHPNICTIYEIDETADGQIFIAMAFYEGETLKQKVASGQLSVNSVIDIGIQIAQGLAKAHLHGITHRDIKPANVIITQDGVAKILDFGLAKFAGQTRLTKTGTTVGTPAYMSPEQINLIEVDHRTDIWSLGVVLYEMIANQLPFKGEYEQALMYSIVNEKPEPLARYKAGVSEGLQHIIDKALDKDRETRYQHVDDLLADLKRERKSSSEVVKPKEKIRKQKAKTPWLHYTAFGVILFAMVAIGVFLLNRQPTYQAPIIHKQVTFTGKASLPAISPDGEFAAYVTHDSTSQKVLVQDLAGGAPLEIFSGITVDLPIRWSPDGSELLFWARLHDSSYGNFLFPRLGGKRRRIRGWPIYCWSPDGSLIAHTSWPQKKIWFTNKTTEVTGWIPLQDSFKWIWDIDWSPLGDRLLFLTSDQKQYAIWTIKIDGNEQRKVVEDSVKLFSPRWSARGNAIYFLRENGETLNLMKIKVASASGKATSAANTLQTGLVAGDTFFLSRDNKRLLYTHELHFSNLWLVTPEARDKAQTIRTKQLTTGTLLKQWPRISPDGERVVLSTGTRTKTNIFVMPIAGGEMEQLTFLDSYNTSPAWSPDGKEIVFGSNQGGESKVWKVLATGGTPRPLGKSELSSSGSGHITWAPGSRILYQRPGNMNFYFLNAKTQEESLLFENDFDHIFSPRYSPDEKMVAVFWNRGEENKRGLWVISLVDLSQIFLSKGTVNPIEWSVDGKFIFAWDVDKSPLKILQIPISGGEPKIHLAIPFDDVDKPQGITMTPDGKRIICSVVEVQTDVWLMENFDPKSEELKAQIDVSDLPEMKQLTYLQDGAELRQRKKDLEAEKVFREGLALNPRHLSLLIQLGRSLVNQKKYSDAEEVFRRGLEVNSNQIDVLNGLGWSLFSQRKYQEGQEIFVKALEISPIDTSTLNGLRQVSLINKDYESAKRYNTKFLELSRQSREKLSAHFTFARIDILQKNYAGAENHLRNALSIDSTDSEAQRLFGYLFANQKRYNEAIQASERAFSMDSSFASYNLMAWVLVAGENDIDRGLSFAEKALEAKPEDWAQTADTYSYYAIPEHTLGLAYLKKGEYEKAIQYLQQAAEFAPERENLKFDLQLARQKLQEMKNK